MSDISRKIRIDAPVEQVWKVVSRFGDIEEFNPGVPKSYLTSEQSAGIGSTRHCDLTIPGASIEERVIEWEENRLYSVEIYDGEKVPPFARATASFELKGDGDGTEVDFTLAYTLKMGIIGRLMDALMVRRQFAKTAEGIVAGLKHYCETGQTVGSDTEIDYGAVFRTA